MRAFYESELKLCYSLVSDIGKGQMRDDNNVNLNVCLRRIFIIISRKEKLLVNRICFA